MTVELFGSPKQVRMRCSAEHFRLSGCEQPNIVNGIVCSKFSLTTKIFPLLRPSHPALPVGCQFHGGDAVVSPHYADLATTDQMEIHTAKSIGDQQESTCAPRQTEDRPSHSREDLDGASVALSEDALATVLSSGSTTISARGGLKFV
jgi:hypothetical protein